jgi:hypothetical protein
VLTSFRQSFGVTSGIGSVDLLAAPNSPGVLPSARLHLRFVWDPELGENHFRPDVWQWNRGGHGGLEQRSCSNGDPSTGGQSYEIDQSSGVRVVGLGQTLQLGPFITGSPVDAYVSLGDYFNLELAYHLSEGTLNPISSQFQTPSATDALWPDRS